MSRNLPTRPWIPTSARSSGAIGTGRITFAAPLPSDLEGRDNPVGAHRRGQSYHGLWRLPDQNFGGMRQASYLFPDGFTSDSEREERLRQKYQAKKAAAAAKALAESKKQEKVEENEGKKKGSKGEGGEKEKKYPDEPDGFRWVEIVIE